MKYRVVYDDTFEKMARRYSLAARLHLEQSIALLIDDPFHPKLHTKPLVGPLKGFYTFRLGRDIRVIFVFCDEATIHLLKIAKRDEVYR